MATNRFRGDAVAIKQVVTVQITANDVVTTYKITINGKVVSVLGNADGVNSTASDLQTALDASTIPEFAEVTWTVSTDTVTGTAATAGVPFTATSSVSGGAGTIGAVTTTTASAGPNDWSTAGNWSLGAVPVNGDDVVIENSSVDISYGLDQSAVTLASLTIENTYTGKLGLPDYTTGSTSYYQYRDKYLKIGATTCNLGRGDGQGSGRVKIDFGSVATTVNVEGAGSPADTGLPAVILNGSNAGNVLNATQGTIGLAIDAGSTAQFPTIRVGSETSQATDVTLTCGTGCTLATINQNGGVVTVGSNVTTWTKTSGTSTNLYSSAITTITADSGTHYWQSNGTITTGTFRGDGTVLDCTRDLRSRTLTGSTFTGGAYFLDPSKTVTFTNPFATDKKSAALHNYGEAPFSLQRS